MTKKKNVSRPRVRRPRSRRKGNLPVPTVPSILDLFASLFGGHREPPQEEIKSEFEKEMKMYTFCEMLEMVYAFSDDTMKNLLSQISEFEKQRMVIASREIGQMIREKYEFPPMHAGCLLLMAGMEFLKMEHDRQHGG